MAGQNTRHRSPQPGGVHKHPHPLENSSAALVRPNSLMDDERITKRLFYGELAGGRCFVGGQRKRHKDTLKASLNDFGIDPALWESLIEERYAWRSVIIDGATAHEQNRTMLKEKKRELCKF